MDGARSDDPRVQQQLDRLNALGPGSDSLGLDRIARLLDRLGNPEHDLPPVFHVAGTNGKGSTCAFLRAAIEADGRTAHVFTSPHLVRFNERFRIAGELISDAMLADLLAEVLDRNEHVGASFFEVSTAVAFLAFARNPADAAIVEVGLGGRLDATNVLPSPACCGIAALGVDHEAFLLSEDAAAPATADPLVRIAWEKAGIAKAGSPLVTQDYGSDMNAIIASHCEAVGAPLFVRNRDWTARCEGDGLIYEDRQGRLSLPLPTMPGPHQADNAALAIAMLRHQDVVAVGKDSLAGAMASANWPARLQRLRPGPLTRFAGADAEIWLDGGHNANAAAALADALAGRKVHLVMGLLANKGLDVFLAPLAPLIETLHAVPVPGHQSHEPELICRRAHETFGIAQCHAVADVETALRHIAASDKAHLPILICGSLYLAGEILRRNGQVPA